MIDAVDMRAIRAQETFLDALRLCVDTSGVKRMAIAASLGKDESWLSKVLSEEKTGVKRPFFPPEEVPRLMEVCGNQIPMLWLVDHCGYDINSLRLREIELERRLREAQERIDILEAERRAEKQYLQDVLARARGGL